MVPLGSNILSHKKWMGLCIPYYNTEAILRTGLLIMGKNGCGSLLLDLIDTHF